MCAGAGFLLAVLWFDLMHDVQVLRLPAGEDPSAALTSIARYYRRVTTDARPMNLTPMSPFGVDCHKRARVRDNCPCHQQQCCLDPRRALTLSVASRSET